MAHVVDAVAGEIIVAQEEPSGGPARTCEAAKGGLLDGKALRVELGGPTGIAVVSFLCGPAKVKRQGARSCGAHALPHG